MSQRASARIKSIDASRALAMEGVRGVYTADDVPGDQLIGDIIVDEPVFARDRVSFVGQTIAIVVADSDELAHIAARAVVVEYDEPEQPPVLTIDDAVERNSFFEMHDHTIEKGDVDAALVCLYCHSFFCITFYLMLSTHTYFELEIRKTCDQRKSSFGWSRTFLF
jgi:xanthine dehydrogenase molybdopterin-binding subunit B